MTSVEVDGTLTRQLLPWPLPQGPSSPKLRAEIRKLFRYVTWVVEPVTYAQANAHLDIGGPSACAVMVVRGPKGGWTGAQFVVLSKNGQGLPRKFKQGTTWYYGWVHSPGLPHPRDIMMPRPQWRATLELHAPGTEVT